MSSSTVVNSIRIIPRDNAFLNRNTGSSGEIYFNKNTNSLRLYSGKVPGGYELLSEGNLAKILGDLQTASISYTVTVGTDTVSSDPNGKFYIDGVEAPDLTFVKGYTYVFDQSDETNASFNSTTHPLMFDTDSGHYTDGVLFVLDDIPVTMATFVERFTFADSRKVYITVKSSAPETIEYGGTQGGNITVGLPGSGSGGGSGASVDVSDTPPSSPSSGNIWFNSSTGVLYVYVTDTDSSQWVQPAVPVPSAFNAVAFGDSTQFSANGSDTITFLDGPGIEISSDPANKTITISALGGGGGGSSFDQNLNTDDDVTFASVSAATFTNTGVGLPQIDSATTLTLNTSDGVIVTGAQFRLPSFTTTQRGTLIPSNGDLIYNTTVNRIQAYQSGGWINLDDGSTA